MTSWDYRNNLNQDMNKWEIETFLEVFQELKSL